MDAAIMKQKNITVIPTYNKIALEGVVSLRTVETFHNPN